MSGGVPRHERIAFAAGDTGFNFVWQTIELYLLFYYVRIVGLSPGQAAGIFLIGGAIDLLGDPLIGALVDRLRTSVPARGWMLLGGPPLGLMLALAFLAPDLGGGTVAPILAVTHALLRVTYSLGNIPYATLTARITDAPREQVRLTATRMQGAALGGLIAAAVYRTLPLSYQWHGVPYGAIALGVLAQPLFLWTWAGVHERTAPPAAVQAELGEQLRGLATLVRRAPVLVRLLLLIFCAGLSTTVLHKGLLFVFDRLGDRGLGYTAALVPSIALFAGAPLWSILAARRGRVATLRAAALVHLAAIGVASISQDDAPFAAASLAMAIFGSAGVSTMFWALVPGVIEYCESGIATEGCAARVYGLANLARKLSQAIAPVAITLSLRLPGATVLPGMAAAGLLALAAAWLFTPRGGELRSSRQDSLT